MTAKAKAAPKTAKKAPAKKAAPKKTVAKKKAPAKKAPLRKKVTRRKSVTAEQRFMMIQDAAFYAAEKGGFSEDPIRYWLIAEAEIDKLVKQK